MYFTLSNTSISEVLQVGIKLCTCIVTMKIDATEQKRTSNLQEADVNSLLFHFHRVMNFLQTDGIKYV